MATKLITVLVDDLDGSEAEETVSFQVDGVTYDIDLNATHAGELRSILRPYIQAGRKQRTATASRRRAAPTDSRPTSAQVRAWAQEQGIAVNNRGRVGAEILAQYEAAH
ncbi:Lsr2 family protein [Pseudarthrobacter phenanthrenivorans]|uniref:histone-like nucleoid-structuring protein Lsr2 n=1 Tax=Pseudarthrobacter phenanthrenivorans TaxID=361575 RepID=UPI00112E8D3C|nr:Lsr2 family protein [Pseudarthrobacter phenanthrenivorans]TPV47489.1 Lsr2 family protein [Pseudarthrobacter phenanthrenivorans]